VGSGDGGCRAGADVAAVCDSGGVTDSAKVVRPVCKICDVATPRAWDFVG
jgi:hypothetical protein